MARDLMLAAAMTLILLTGCTVSESRTDLPIPAALTAPQGQIRIATFHATGVQIYTCKAKASDPSQTNWSFLAPEAELHDATGAVVGNHFGGPTWEAKDGSQVVGSVSAQLEAPHNQGVAWLLLRATSTKGPGIFAHITSIQRLNTVGGLAPVGGCGPATVGQEARVAYQADYLFYNEKS